MKMLNKKLLELNINEIAQDDLCENNIFGSAYVVTQNGEKICENFFGVTDLKNRGQVSKDTIFRLASMTKPVTAMAILVLIDKGLISLSDSVKKYFPQFENIHIILEDGTNLGKTKTDVTVLHLLTHTSGFGSIKPCNMSYEDKKTIQNTVNYFLKAGLDFEPFTTQSYSPFAAFDVLAALVEKITGQDYGYFLKNEIFEPCNMKETTFIPSESQRKRIIAMHDKIDGKNGVGKTKDNCVFEDFPCEHKLAGAGLISTITDYSNFAEMLLNKGRYDEAQIVSQDTFNLLTVPYIPCRENEAWGLGVRVVTNEAHPILPVGAFGWSGAYGTHFWVDPENKITAVFMKNSRYDGGAYNESACRFEKAVYEALPG